MVIPVFPENRIPQDPHLPPLVLTRQCSPHEKHRVKVVVRYRPSHPSVSTVDLLGEASDWRNAIALARDASGDFVRTLDLPPGVYQTKLLVDHVWTLDHDNTRTRSSRGLTNNVLGVDDAPEPFLFAPAPPWTEALDRGGMRVLIGVRKPVPPFTFSFSEDAATTFHRVTPIIAFEEDEHVFFTANVPSSTPVVHLALETDGIRHVARWARPPALERIPAWWYDAAIYGIFVDRFRASTDRDDWHRDPGKHRAAGGHLAGITRSLDALVDLGISALYLTPVHIGASVHRYDVVDPLRVDPDLGGEKAYAELVAAARERGMRILQDVSFAHAGRGFPAYEDVLVRGRASRFAPWFQWKNDALVHYGKRTDAPLFDLENDEVAKLVLRAVETWARLGASGVRLDMTAEVPIALGQRIRQRFRELVPDGVVLGEVVPQHAWRWRAERVVDAATDFDFHAIATSLVCDPTASVADAIERLHADELRRGGDVHSACVRFLSTHDHPRLATLAMHAKREGLLPLAYAMLATMPGIPMLLYGEEIGMRSESAELEVENVWPDRAPRPWTLGRRDERLHATVRELFTARARENVLRYGAFRVLFADEKILVYRREDGGDVVDVALNFSSEPVTAVLDDDDRPVLRPFVTCGDTSAHGATVTLAPFGVTIAKRERPLGQAISPGTARRNLTLRDADLKDGRDRATSRPTRFLFSVTERCNLRCEHCITHAPSLTKSGAARTMTKAVVDALREDFGFGTYFGFVHGGESLTAPILFDVLDAIRESRGKEPYVAHLLTNGILLDVATADRLVRAGVSSVSVSLDGATAKTNDAIRVGGRFEDVVANLAAVVTWKKRANADLRLGLSYVVLAQNVHELGAFIGLAHTLGVDWVKLEEGVPATEFAKRSLVSCNSADTRRAIDDAVTQGKRSGLVVVDHTIERQIWRCNLDADARAFLEADEFANRAKIHPCRTPWETACIEPNGDVRAVDFFGAVLGTVTQSPLTDLWNTQPALDARRRVLHTRLCGSGPVVCV